MQGQDEEVFARLRHACSTLQGHCRRPQGSPMMPTCRGYGGATQLPAARGAANSENFRPVSASMMRFHVYTPGQRPAIGGCVLAWCRAALSEPPNVDWPGSLHCILTPGPQPSRLAELADLAEQACREPGCLCHEREPDDAFRALEARRLFQTEQCAVRPNAALCRTTGGFRCPARHRRDPLVLHVNTTDIGTRAAPESSSGPSDSRPLSVSYCIRAPTQYSFFRGSCPLFLSLLAPLHPHLSATKLQLSAYCIGQAILSYNCLRARIRRLSHT